MTKQELMENYTEEQLAEMEKLYRDITQCREHIGEHLHSEEYLKILSLNRTISGLQSEVEKYRKAFEDAKKERDCRIEEYRKKIEELTNENEKLKGDVGSEGYQEKQEKTNNFYGMYKFAAKDLSKENLLMFLGILTKELLKNGIDFRYEMDNEPKVWDITSKNDKTVADLLPTEPIKVADMLINVMHEPCASVLSFGKPYSMYDISELRQIAEHLLIYCNHNVEDN